MTTLPRTLFLASSLFLLFLAAAPARAQTTFGPQQVITTDAENPYSVRAADLDGDGDIDVLTASYVGARWHENMDGLGAFGPPRQISTLLMGGRAVRAADLDGDGDLDVLVGAAMPGSDKIVWYENTDGLGTFGAPQLISTLIKIPHTVEAFDIDGDGDLDVLSASFDDDKIAWYENTDGLGTFGSQQIITTTANGAHSVFASDLDGDGDLDVLSASQNDDKIAWYENTDGLGSFGPRQILTSNANGAQTVFASDLDGDGDSDVLSGSFFDDKVAWYENTDGLGSFGQPQVITTDADAVLEVFASDLDGDGDQDVLSASSYDNKIAWYENTDGLGHFGRQQVISTLTGSPLSVFAADLDGDGDQDVLSTSLTDHTIVWYENLTPVQGAVEVTCTPVSPPIVIPAGGGTYAYDIEFVNNGTSAETFDFWFDIEGPNVDRTRGPFTRTLAAGASVVRTLNQKIPGFAPAGDYTHTCNVGSFSVADDSDSFDWEKSALFAPSDVTVANWTTEAEFAAALGAPALTAEVPPDYALENSYPNPFNPATTIRFSLPESANIRLVVFDVLGRQVRVLADGAREAGTHEVVFDASDLPSGTYLYRLETPQGSFVRTMLLAK